MMKIVAILALVAVAAAAPGAIIATSGHLPASTGPLTYAVAPALTYAAAPAYTYAAAPVAVAHAAPAIAVPAPVAYQTGVKVTHTVEPVEQHGYQIAY